MNISYGDLISMVGIDKAYELDKELNALSRKENVKNFHNQYFLEGKNVYAIRYGGTHNSETHQDFRQVRTEAELIYVLQH